jgi:hypothetical protein
MGLVAQVVRVEVAVAVEMLSCPYPMELLARVALVQLLFVIQWLVKEI